MWVSYQFDIFVRPTVLKWGKVPVVPKKITPRCYTLMEKNGHPNLLKI